MGAAGGCRCFCPRTHRARIILLLVDLNQSVRVTYLTYILHTVSRFKLLPSWLRDTLVMSSVWKLSVTLFLVADAACFCSSFPSALSTPFSLLIVTSTISSHCIFTLIRPPCPLPSVFIRYPVTICMLFMLTDQAKNWSSGYDILIIVSYIVYGNNFFLQIVLFKIWCVYVYEE